MSRNEIKHKITKASNGTLFFAEDFTNLTPKQNT